MWAGEGWVGGNVYERPQEDMRFRPAARGAPTAVGTCAQCGRRSRGRAQPREGRLRWRLYLRGISVQGRGSSHVLTPASAIWTSHTTSVGPPSLSGQLQNTQNTLRTLCDLVPVISEVVFRTLQSHCKLFGMREVN